MVLVQHTGLKESVQAESLAEAPRVLGDLGGRIDLAIVNLDMPNGDAAELIKEPGGAGPDVPVLAFTVGRDSPMRAEAFRAGADQVLSAATSGEKIARAAQLLVGG